ncbi:Mce4/Rv3499c/MTV023.06c protein [Shewanella piezotolerans WP3]|uniref:Mce4/Rv3499c/MTV023.06c protein n=1 Tax=Shewanella piezotolerans (strain WP3 / JCM 13877) TaxID=225849 RepID=B8CPH5_SHEPW|nr:MlaD family protein [Shewanella piezotolerans]ACJ29551.1 Mce4/Rv3499c/MTV023.06c protein [Shewanella piezotolerans WP3]
MTQVQTPKVVKKKLFSPIWLLPIIALALGAWLGVKSIRESGVEVRIHFPSATGMDIGKTLVKYQGLTVGKVVDISIDDDLQGVNVDVLMDYRSSPFLNKDTKFWLVKPKASITGVEGLDTLFSGNYIGILPGEGESASFFEAEISAPVITPGNEGLIVNITSEKLGSLDVGSPLFYRQIPVGQVVGYRLDSSNKIIVTAFIQQQYANLVKVDSQFWNVSGISVDASLAGIEVRTESLAAILAGGISFSSNDKSAPAENRHEFALYDSEKQAFGGIEFTLTANGTESVANNTAIVFRGINIGRVTNKILTDNGISLEAKIDSKYAELLAGTSSFWLEGADISLSGINHPERLLTGSVINFITGSGDPLQQYPLLTTKPEPLNSNKLTLTLDSDTNPGVSAGAELRFKQIKIGTVLSSKLNKELTKVEYNIEVDADFSSLLTKGSYFVAESVLSVEANLDGVAVKARDLSTFTNGALSLIKGASNQQLANGALLRVFASNKEADSYFENSRLITRQLFSNDAADVVDGSPVYYKKMQIGQVNKVEWQRKSNDFIIDISIQKTFESLLTDKTVFWRNSALAINASLSGIEVEMSPLQGAIKGGITLGLLEQPAQGHENQLYASKFLALSQSTAITMTFPASVKLAKKAPIRYLGHKVGEVESVVLSKDLTELNVSAYLYGDYAANFNQQDASFSIVDAKVSLSGIEAPETLITGPYISVVPGISTQTASRFAGLIDKPFYNLDNALTFIITNNNLGSINKGTAIFFRGIKVGQVDSYQLIADGTGVEMTAHIESRYKHLVNSSSVLWDLSGVKVDVGLFSGAQIETGSLETILTGGIGLATKEVTSVENMIAPQHKFPLNAAVDPIWLDWAPKQSATD